MPLKENFYHSTRPGTTVFHSHSDCTEGNNIESYYFQWGTGGKDLCKHCIRLSNEEANKKNTPFVGGFSRSALGLFQHPLAAAYLAAKGKK